MSLIRTVTGCVIEVLPSFSLYGSCVEPWLARTFEGMGRRSGTLTEGLRGSHRVVPSSCFGTIYGVCKMNTRLMEPIVG